MNQQQIFDQAIEHLAKQGGPSKSEDGPSCLYRGPNGRCCVVGHFIPDHAYLPAMDRGLFGSSLDIEAVLADFPNRLPRWFKDHVGLLADLQLTVHDPSENHEGRAWNVGKLRGSLELLALDYTLNPAAIDRFFPRS